MKSLSHWLLCGALAASLTWNWKLYERADAPAECAASTGCALAGDGLCLGALMTGLAGGIAVSRVYLGAHYPLDVAAGAIVGIATGLACRAMLGI